MPATPVDPWTAFLQWLSTIIIPDWNGLIELLPILIILGVIGPALTLLVLYWIYVLRHKPARQGALRRPAADRLAANADGTYTYPPNAPYCPTHHLIYPADRPRVRRSTATTCSVRCPVDDTVRVAGQQLCRTCGTRYQLGASLAPIVVRRRGTPPAGGAAVAWESRDSLTWRKLSYYAFDVGTVTLAIALHAARASTRRCSPLVARQTAGRGRSGGTTSTSVTVGRSGSSATSAGDIGQVFTWASFVLRRSRPHHACLSRRPWPVGQPVRVQRRLRASASWPATCTWAAATRSRRSRSCRSASRSS